MQLKYKVFIILVILIVVSCDSKRFYEKNLPIKNEVWNVNDKPYFEVEIKDTLQFYNFYINLRHNASYAYSNIYLFLNTYFPNGEKSRDTIECILADNRGFWLGKGTEIIEHQILFKRKVRFPMSGLYRFEFEQAMRKDDLEDIMDIGLRIEYFE
ncbi:MAG: gliding motility lipoprotein GldH [Bacteroidia bacterium]